jgi:hypothetical protein
MPQLAWCPLPGSMRERGGARGEKSRRTLAHPSPSRMQCEDQPCLLPTVAGRGECARSCGSRCCGSGGGLTSFLIDQPVWRSSQPLPRGRRTRWWGGLRSSRVVVVDRRASRSDLDIGSCVRSARAGGSRRARTPVWRLEQRIQYCDDPKSLQAKDRSWPHVQRFLPRH